MFLAGSSLVVQWVKNLVISLLWLRNFYMPQAQQKKPKKQKETKNSSCRANALRQATAYHMEGAGGQLQQSELREKQLQQSELREEQLKQSEPREEQLKQSEPREEQREMRSEERGGRWFRALGILYVLGL